MQYEYINTNKHHAFLADFKQFAKITKALINPGLRYAYVYDLTQIY